MLRVLTLNAPVGQLLRRYQTMTLIISLVIFASIALKLESIFQVSSFTPCHLLQQMIGNIFDTQTKKQPGPTITDFENSFDTKTHFGFSKRYQNQ